MSEPRKEPVPPEVGPGEAAAAFRAQHPATRASGRRVAAAILRRLLPPVLAGVVVVALLQPWFIVPRCAEAPARCDADALAPWDRWSIERHEAWAARVDEALQWSVTGIALALPVLMRTAPGTGMAAIALDWLLLAETAAWNWASTETAQLLVQRPRPPLFNRSVNTKPLDRRSQYTSFWSGHTSYVAAMGVAFACLARRQGRPNATRALLAFAVISSVATGAFRILEGRHFLLDVIAGAVAGAVVGLVVFRWRRGEGTG